MVIEDSELGAQDGLEQDVYEPTQEEIAKELGSIEGTGDEGGDLGVGADEGGGDNDQLDLDTDIVSAYSEMIGEEIDDDFFKGEDGKFISKKEALTKLNSVVAYKTKHDISSDPFIGNYLKAKAADGFSHDQYISSLTETNRIKDMSSKEFLTRYYKGMNYSDEEISKVIAAQTTIGLDELAAKYKGAIIEDQNRKLSKQFEENVTSRKQELQVKNTNISNAVDDFINNNLKSEKFPIHFAEGDIKDIQGTIKSLLEVEVVVENGKIYETTRLDKFLGDDEKIEQVLPFIALAESGKLTDWLKNHVRDIKNREFEKIENVSSVGSGGSSSGAKNWGKFFG